MAPHPIVDDVARSTLETTFARLRLDPSAAGDVGKTMARDSLGGRGAALPTSLLTTDGATDYDPLPGLTAGALYTGLLAVLNVFRIVARAFHRHLQRQRARPA